MRKSMFNHCLSCFVMLVSICIWTPVYASTTYKVKVTNDAGRQLKMRVYCGSTKITIKTYPASKGKTRSFTTSCASSSIKVRFQAKIGANWKKVQVDHSKSGGMDTKKTIIPTGNYSSTTSWVSLSNLINSGNKACMKFYELGKVKAFPRKCSGSNSSATTSGTYNTTSATYKVRVTNNAGRLLKMSVYCGGDKITVKTFPASKGKTRSFTTKCASSSIKVRFQAKIGANWNKVRFFHSRSGGMEGKSAIAPTGNYVTTGMWVEWGDLIDSGSKACIKAFEIGKVKAFPRKCR